MQMLRVSQKVLRQCADQGLIQRVELNARVHRYTLASIEALISQNEAPGANGDLVTLGVGAADRGSA
jgi:hypothetical protein